MLTLEFLREFRFAGYAIFDIAVSFLGIYLLAPLLSKLFLKLSLDIPRLSWMYFTLPLGILIHILVGQFTPMTRSVIEPQGDYLLKFIMLLLLVLGFRGIKVVKAGK